MINKQDIFSEIVLMNVKGRPASQEKFLIAWKDSVCRLKELNAGSDIDNINKLSLLQVDRTYECLGLTGFSREVPYCLEG
jgi:hypothetical protein